MVMRVLPPDEAKRKARANLAAWKREKEKAELTRRRGEARAGPPKTDIGRVEAGKAGREGDETLDEALLRCLKDTRPHDLAGVDVAWMESICDLARRGADIDLMDSRGMNALHYAANRDWEEAVRAFVNLGADVNARDSDGWSVLDHAALYLNERIAQFREPNKHIWRLSRTVDFLKSKGAKRCRYA